MLSSAEPSQRHQWIQQRVAQLGDWFQNLDLEGVATAPHHFLGDYPRAKWSQIAPALPARLDGLSVLDIGCNAGFHAFECKRRGARRVLGVDADPRYLDQARLAAQVLGLEVEWRQLSVYGLDQIEGTFDYVLFLGLFYHLRYPLYGLDLAVKKARQALLFQTMVRGETVRPEVRENYDFWDHSPFRQPGFPCMYFVEHRYANDQTNWWIPNPAAVEGMLRTAGLDLIAHPEAETWLCRPRLANDEAGASVHERELAGVL